MRPKLPFKKDDHGSHIRALQRILVLLGCKHPPLVRGLFKTNTEDGVRELQRKFKLPETGIVDARFIDKLHKLAGVEFWKVAEFGDMHEAFAITPMPQDVAAKNGDS